MIARWQWVLKRISKRLWFRTGLFSVLGVATALLALAVKPYIPDDLSARVGADALSMIPAPRSTSLAEGYASFHGGTGDRS